MFANYLDFMYFVGHTKGSFFSNDGASCALGAPEAIRAMELMAEFGRCVPPGSLSERVQLFRQGRAAMLIGYPTTLAKADRVLSVAHRVLPLPEYRRGIVPLDVNGMAIHTGAAWPEAGIQFLKLYVESRLGGPEPRRMPLCVDRACEDTSPMMRPVRESLDYGRDILWNVPADVRTMRHDLALQVFDARCESIALGEPAQIAERMKALAADMTQVIVGRVDSEAL
jgi:hypothetical protein